MASLSEEEITALKKLVPLADVIATDAEYQKSRNLVWKHWKGLIITVAAALTAVLFIGDKLKAVWLWVFR